MYLSVFEDRIKELGKIDFGAKFEFSPDYFPPIPETITDADIYIELRQRFVSYGLIDNLIVHLSKDSSIAFGLWILAAYFQGKYDKYVLRLENENSAIKEVWIDFRGDKVFTAGAAEPSFVDNRRIRVRLDKFVWTADSVETFAQNRSPYFNQKISLCVTNTVEDYFTMEQFYQRDVLIGFGEIGGGCLAVEFFLNFGLEKSNVNYEYIKYQYAARNLADENSCEIRAELTGAKRRSPDDSISENN
jgi:hypothetical protein